MNRKEEYRALLSELEQLPPELEQTVERAVRRKRKLRNKRRFWGIPVGSLAACFLGFVLLVNLFPPFARACGNVPVLRELAEAVAWSPSLSAAVQHDYVQPIGQTKTEMGFTASVEYVIVDRKQVSMFYTLEYDAALWEQVHVDYEYGDLHGWAGDAGTLWQKPGELREISMNFVDQDVPATLDLALKISAEPRTDQSAGPTEYVGNSLFEEPHYEEPDYLAELTFTLEFDPSYTAQGTVIPVNADFTLDGQRFTLTEVELYPTHLRVNLEDDPTNTAWLRGVDLYLENEHGERFGSSINGITASGDPDGEGYATFWLDSPFFSQGEHLTLYISGADWKDKDAPRVRVDLGTGTAEHLPDGIQFLRAEQQAEGWIVYFTMPRETNGSLYNNFSGGFWDEAGNHYEIWQFGHTYGYRDPVTGETVEEDTMFTENFPLAGFEGDVVYLEPNRNRTTDFSIPVSIPIS
ncbi:hypothetical protein MM59RIKEN_31750 (plasmid) [Pusillibacter faecalis]|uniref:DUF4179 domain-containing protein n=1 Tax=Pusillibacter faecalis TaxID=2714358 RepID=A0A830QSI6_9FIRM|nr:DUF4179 domain-containing protein [Pusillibacter faecalis]BCK85856.1 hypothetical protein MM59RIKEN_31750 [Pusillibacter faecalis]